MATKYYFKYEITSRMLYSTKTNNIKETWNSLAKPVAYYADENMLFRFIEGNEATHIFVFNKIKNDNEKFKNSYEVIGFCEEPDYYKAIRSSKKMLEDDGFYHIKTLKNTTKILVPNENHMIDLSNINFFEKLIIPQNIIIFLFLIISVFLLLLARVFNWKFFTEIVSFIISFAISLIAECAESLFSKKYIEMKNIYSFVGYDEPITEKQYSSPETIINRRRGGN